MIQIRNLHFSYSKLKPVLSAFDLELKAGKIYGLLGKNGAGKTTLLNLLCGVLFPSKGKIQIDDFTPAQRKVKFLNQLYYVPEELEMPPIQIQSLAILYGSFYPKFDAEKFTRIISSFGLNHKEQLKSLSYGQKRIVAIAFGLSAGVKYLFIDEPTKGLDIPSKSHLRKLISKETRDDQVVIISTHQIRDLSQILESVLIIDEGTVLIAEDLSELEEKYFFERSAIQDPDSIWSEMSSGSYINIHPNIHALTSELDLEVLFNATISGAFENQNMIKKTTNGI